MAMMIERDCKVKMSLEHLSSNNNFDIDIGRCQGPDESRRLATIRRRDHKNNMTNIWAILQCLNHYYKIFTTTFSVALIRHSQRHK